MAAPLLAYGVDQIDEYLSGALGEQILQLGGSFQLACSFRDEIIVKTHIGRRILDDYYLTLPRTFAIVNSDPEILFKAIDVWRSNWLLTLGLVSLANGTEESTESARISFTNARYESLMRLIQALRSATDDEGYLGFLGEVEREIQNYIDQPAVEILRLIRREE